jgi:hypothetical protein
VLRDFAAADGARRAGVRRGRRPRPQGAHPPEICYRGQGWTIEQQRSWELALAGTHAAVDELVVAQRGERLLVWSWYRVGDDETASWWREQWLALAARVGRRDAPAALLRFSTPLGSDGIERRPPRASPASWRNSFRPPTPRLRAPARRGRKSRRQMNAISIDVEEYFHAVNLRAAFPEARVGRLPRRAMVGVETALRLLDRAGQQGDLLRPRMDRGARARGGARDRSAGHEIASHGHSHRMAHELGPRGSRPTCAAASSCSRRSRRARSAASARRPSRHGATWWALAARREARPRLRLEHLPGPPRPLRHARLRARAGRARASAGRRIVELPLLTWRLAGQNLPAAGGGYLRQLPLWFTRRALAAMNRDGAPGVVYLHPWELDPGQPRAAPGVIGRVGHLRHYRNLDRTEERLGRLVGEFAFAPLDALARRARPLRAAPVAAAGIGRST